MFKNSPDSPGTRLNTVLIGFAALILMAVVGVSYREWRQFSRANADAARTREIIDSVDRLLYSLTDAETGQRGFLLTGENSYLEPYNRAVPTISDNLSHLKSLLAARREESATAARLDSVVNEKLNELAQTIALRRTPGAQSALALVLSDRGEREMDEIRELGADIKRREASAQNRAFLEGETAARSVLLASVLGALVLIFLFAFRMEPFTPLDPSRKEERWAVRYGAAVLAVGAAFLFRLALTPVIGPTSLVFTLFFPAVLFVSWFGGFRAGVLSIALSALAATYYFAGPTRSFAIGNTQDQVEFVIFVVVGFGVALLGHSQRWAVDIARDERERFETTLASIGDAVIATDAEGRATFVNKVASSLLKAAAPNLVGRHLDDVFCIVNEITRARVENPVAKLLREGEVVGLANPTVLIAQDGSEVPIDDSAAPIYMEGGRILGMVLVFRDITARRAKEKLLAAQTAELRQKAHLMENVHCFVRDQEDRIVFWNQGAADLYGFSADQAVGQVSHTLLKTVFPTPLEDILAQLKSVGEWDGELIHTRRAGDRVTVASHWALHRDEGGRPVAILEVNVDITDRKRAEEVRRESELNARLLYVQEEERRRVGRELHDSAGQNLILLKIHLDLLALSPSPGDSMRGKLAECIRLANELIKEIRTIAFTLYPPMLEDGGLKSAIPSYLDGFKERSGLAVNFEISPEFVRLPREMELAIFRVLQESLTNVLRHSGSPVANIWLDLKDGMIRLEIADQGKGMPPEVLKALNRESLGEVGVGLRGMKERIRQLGGQLNVSSSPGGTIVSAAVALGITS